MEVESCLLSTLLITTRSSSVLPMKNLNPPKSRSLFKGDVIRDFDLQVSFSSCHFGECTIFQIQGIGSMDESRDPVSWFEGFGHGGTDFKNSASIVATNTGTRRG